MRAASRRTVFVAARDLLVPLVLVVLVSDDANDNITGPVLPVEDLTMQTDFRVRAAHGGSGGEPLIAVRINGDRVSLEGPCALTLGMALAADGSLGEGEIDFDARIGRAVCERIHFGLLAAGLDGYIWIDVEGKRQSRGGGRLRDGCAVAELAFRVTPPTKRLT